jgi:hypothetical protein
MGHDLLRVDPNTSAITRISAKDGDIFTGLATDVAGSALYSAETPLRTYGVAAGGTIAQRDTTTGAVLHSAQAATYFGAPLAGVAGGKIWSRNGHPGMSGEVDVLDGATFAQVGGFDGDNTIDVVVTSGTPWISAANLTLGNVRPTWNALFACVNAASGVAAAGFDLSAYPDAQYDQLPEGTLTIGIVGSGLDLMFTTFDNAVVVYPLDPQCKP